MGKKGKVGKSRKDKFYHLAKETGYRARSAFKLIQLNRKFGFLQESRVLIDLCAAPGGWLQVASKFMPISSVIIGVDLASIKPIKNVITFQADITGEQCRQMIKKEIKTWKADVVLNDGAPNVGAAWVQDAFAQAQLALSALKLASEFLRRGGWFITKIFRSKDYAALLWVFQKLFKKVHSTKPQASRSESAEIFVVCQGYLAPDKLDEKFLDPKYVFKEIQDESKIRLNILHPEKHTRHRDGYEEGNMSLHTTVKASEFIQSSSAIEILSTSNRIELDEERIQSHAATTDEIRECCKDIKVLGKRELKALFAWRKKLRKDFNMEVTEPVEKSEGESTKAEVEKTAEEKEKEVTTMIEELKEQEAKDIRKKKKKVREEKKKLREKLASKLSAAVESSAEMDLFSLNVMRNKQDLEAVEANAENHDSGSPEVGDEVASAGDADGSGSDDDDHEDGKYIYGDDELYEKPPKRRRPESSQTDQSAADLKNTRMPDDTENPLLVSLDDEQKEKATKAAVWYQKEIFKNVEDEEDEEYDIEMILSKRNDSTNQECAVRVGDAGTGEERDITSTEDLQGDDDDRSDSDSEDDSDIDDRSISQKAPGGDSGKVSLKGNTFEVVPQGQEAKHLSAEGLAMGTAMATSKKRKRDIIDDAYNRYSYGQENLPSWFASDEAKHKARVMPITKEEVEFYKQRLREINARPIKKVIEAKAKKKSKMLKKLERARKRADGILDAADVSEKEKQQQIKGIYKRAGLLQKQKKEVTYVVAKKHLAGKKYKRPAGVKGLYKVVDPRLKKDLRAARNKEKTKGRKKPRKR